MYQIPKEKLKLKSLIMSTIIRNEIKELVEIIHEQTNTILSYPERIPQIEIDIVRENLRKLYDLMRQIDKLNVSTIPETNVTVNIEELVHTEVKEEVKAEERVDSYLDFVATTFTNEPPVYEELNVNNIIEEEVKVHEPEKEIPLFTFMEVKEEDIDNQVIDEVVEIQPELIENAGQIDKLEEVEISKEEDSPTIQVVEQISVSEEKANPEPSLFGELIEKPFVVESSQSLTSDTKTVTQNHDSLKSEISAEEKVNAEKVGQSDKKAYNNFIGKPIDSLKRAIGINDKFQFINELFEGNMGRYNKTIDSLDSAGGLERANIIITELAIELEWDSEDKAYIQLQNYLLRRYN